MKIIDGSVYSKEELVEIINNISNMEFAFLIKNYLIDYKDKKHSALLDEAEELLEEKKSLPYTSDGLVRRNEIDKRFDEILKTTIKIRKSLVVNERGE